MSLTGTDVRRRLIEGLGAQTHETRQTRMREIMEKSVDQLPKYEEIAEAFKIMTQTKGWRILEEWLTIKMDVFGIVFEDDAGKEAEKKIRAKAYTELLVYVADAMEAPDQMKSIISRKAGKEATINE